MLTITDTLGDGFKVLLEHGLLRNHVDAELSPLPIVLHETGFILPIDRRTGVPKSGELPEYYRRHTFQRTTPEGRVYTIVIAGDSYLGLPYGSDWKVWLAILRWVDLEGTDDEGWLRDVSMSRLLDMMGVPRDQNSRGTKTRNLALDALERLAHTQITTRLLYIPEQLALDLGPEPVSPGSIDYTRLLEKLDNPSEERVLTDTFDLIKITVDRPANRKSSSRGKLLRLWVNPQILRHVTVGWTTWINVPEHNRLKNIRAMRIYHLFATEMSRGKTSPFVVSLGDLANLISVGLPNEANRNDNLRKLMEAELDNLRTIGVIDAYETIPAPRGRMRLTMFRVHAGRLLRSAKALRGCGLHDTPENRLLVQALGFYGVPVKRAREWVSDDQAHALESILYVLYSQTAEGAKRIDNPAAFLGWAANNRSRFTDQGFQRWLRAQNAKLLERKDETQQELLPPAVVFKRPPDIPEDAWALFDSLLEYISVSEECKPLKLYLRRDCRFVAPLKIAGDSLILRVDNNSFIAEKLEEEKNRELLNEAVATLTEGRVKYVVSELLVPTDAGTGGQDTDLASAPTATTRP